MQMSSFGPPLEIFTGPISADADHLIRVGEEAARQSREKSTTRFPCCVRFERFPVASVKSENLFSDRDTSIDTGTRSSPVSPGLLLSSPIPTLFNFDSISFHSLPKISALITDPVLNHLFCHFACTVPGKDPLHFLGNYTRMSTSRKFLPAA